jgi:3-phenylpropionate/trans-cinnamate dioxygenase ferredoxin component
MISELNEGELFRFDVGDKPLLVVMFEGKVFVTDSICTHEEADLSLGMFADGVVTCPLHRAMFRVESGRVVSGPDGSASGSIRQLKVYPVRVENGYVLADLPQNA